MHHINGLVQDCSISVANALQIPQSHVKPCLTCCWFLDTPWWRHQMETFSALLAICAGNSLVHGEFPTQRPVTRSFDVFFDLRLNKWLSKQSWGWWLETLSCPLWRHCNDTSSRHKHNIKQSVILHIIPHYFMMFYLIIVCIISNVALGAVVNVLQMFDYKESYQNYVVIHKFKIIYCRTLNEEILLFTHTHTHTQTHTYSYESYSCRFKPTHPQT